MFQIGNMCLVIQSSNAAACTRLTQSISDMFERTNTFLTFAACVNKFILDFTPSLVLSWVHVWKRLHCTDVLTQKQLRSNHCRPEVSKMGQFGMQVR